MMTSRLLDAGLPLVIPKGPSFNSMVNLMLNVDWLQGYPIPLPGAVIMPNELATMPEMGRKYGSQAMSRYYVNPGTYFPHGTYRQKAMEMMPAAFFSPITAKELLPYDKGSFVGFKFAHELRNSWVHIPGRPSTHAAYVSQGKITFVGWTEYGEFATEVAPNLFLPAGIRFVRIFMGSGANYSPMEILVVIFPYGTATTDRRAIFNLAWAFQVAIQLGRYQPMQPFSFPEIADLAFMAPNMDLWGAELPRHRTAHKLRIVWAYDAVRLSITKNGGIILQGVTSMISSSHREPENPSLSPIAAQVLHGREPHPQMLLAVQIRPFAEDWRVVNNSRAKHPDQQQWLPVIHTIQPNFMETHLIIATAPQGTLAIKGEARQRIKRG